MALKYSRQRESIKKHLANTTDHPTADMIYSSIRTEYPNISLGTIYRNLNLLVEQGEVIKFATGEGKDRFDANTSSHYHFICTECSNVSDVFINPEFIYMVNDSAKSKVDGEIHGHNTLFFGKCISCKQT